MSSSEPHPAHNTITLASDGALLVVETGQQTKESILQLTKQLAEKIVKLHSQNKRKALVLMDLSRVTGYDTGAYEASQDMLLHADFDTLAILGASQKFRIDGNALITSAQQQQRIQFFDTAQEAARWLAGDVIQQKSAVKSLAHPIWPPRRKKRTI